MLNFFKEQESKKMPVKAKNIIAKYNIPEGKRLGEILNKIEEKWISNDFKISDQEIEKLVKN